MRKLSNSSAKIGSHTRLIQDWQHLARTGSKRGYVALLNLESEFRHFDLQNDDRRMTPVNVIQRRTLWRTVDEVLNLPKTFGLTLHANLQVTENVQRDLMTYEGPTERVTQEHLRKLKATKKNLQAIFLGLEKKIGNVVEKNEKP